jgi:LysM repeat protein
MRSTVFGSVTGRNHEEKSSRRWPAAAALGAAVALGGGAAPAAAEVPHTVVPGDTLWSIAASNNLTTRALAVYNGVDPDANVTLGETIDVPTEGEAAGAMEDAGIEPASESDSGDSESSGGSYVVQPGDTLSEIAAREGASTADLAAINGLDPDDLLVSGTVIELSGSSSDASDDSSDTGSDSSSSPDPDPIGDQVTSSDVASIAEANGVPGSLAAAIAWQESGFDNSAVSSADARGVMQIIPGTWDFVQNALGAGQLDPSSSSDNIRAGVLYLRYLLDQTGGDPSTAAAAYYQGLGSVQSYGLLPETERYVDNVMALRSRFGG